jgi:hypothetical protein
MPSPTSAGAFAAGVERSESLDKARSSLPVKFTAREVHMPVQDSAALNRSGNACELPGRAGLARAEAQALPCRPAVHQ